MSCLLQDCQSLDLTMLPRGSQRDLTHGTVWMAGEGGINPVLMQDPQGVSSPNTQDPLSLWLQAGEGEQAVVNPVLRPAG